jgi:hypothetical protein
MTRPLPGHLAATMGLFGHDSRYAVAASFSRILVVAIFIGVALFIVLLGCALFGEAISGFFSTAKAKTAPVAFFIGLGVLLTGLAAGTRILDIVGACLIGAVLLGAILENY